MKKLVLSCLIFFFLSNIIFSQKCFTSNGCKYFTSECNQRSVEWSGSCKDGFLDGKGLLKVYENGKLLYTVRDCNVRKGKLAGYNYLEFVSGKDIEGIYINGELEKKPTKSCKVYFQDHITSQTERYEYKVDDSESGSTYLLKIFPPTGSDGWSFYYIKNGGSGSSRRYGKASSVEGNIRYFVDNYCECDGWSYK